ncbi:hypothetical protein H0H92_000529 [Tricholoma furcatifolium]|nr:hypothetical protein H0H92_000529 [Tricholoma furcatifolium]
MDPPSQSRQRAGRIRYGHPSPERCKYPSDNENNNARSVINVSSDEDNDLRPLSPPPRVLRKAKATRTPQDSVDHSVSVPFVLAPAVFHEAARDTARPEGVHQEAQSFTSIRLDGERRKSGMWHQYNSQRFCLNANNIKSFSSASNPASSRGTTAPGPEYQAPNVDDEEYYYFVILHGLRPGVYRGRSAANAAGGQGVPTVVHRVFSEEVANMIFVKAFMRREVLRYE